MLPGGRGWMLPGGQWRRHGIHGFNKGAAWPGAKKKGRARNGPGLGDGVRRGEAAYRVAAAPDPTRSPTIFSCTAAGTAS